MRRLLAVAAFFSPWALAQSVIEVESHAFMRLPSNAGVLQLDRLAIADHGTLLIPSGVREIRVAELHLGQQARITIAPAEQVFRLEAAAGEIASGAQIDARGSQGTHQQPALQGRALSVRLGAVVVGPLLVDARGGKGAPGYVGLDGADGMPGGCTWGQASAGHGGQNGGDGQAGAPGAEVRLEVPAGFPVEQLQVRIDGGAGGLPGPGGSGGKGGPSKGCWLYSTDAAADGRPGQAGQAGVQGAAGALDLVQF